MPPEKHAFAHEPRRIAIFRALFLGDLLLTTPAWRALRRRFPQAEISLIGLPWAEAFVARTPGLIDRFVPFAGYPGLAELPYNEERTAAFLAEQRAYGYDLAIQMHGDGTNSNGLVAELDAHFTAGLARPADQRLDLALPYPDGQHELLRWLDLVAALGAPAEETRVELQPSPEDKARAAALLAPAFGAGPLIGLHTGAKDPARRWPTHRFATLADALARHCGARLLLTGSAGEAEQTARVTRTTVAPVLDLAGQTDLGSFAAVMGRLDLLITNDTGASHMAAAVGTPSVVLFGPTRPTEFAPLDRERHMVVDSLEHAAPGLDGATALRQLRVQPVLEAALKQLDRSKTPARLSERAVGGESLCAG